MPDASSFSLLHVIVPMIGAGIVISEGMVAGLVFHKLMLRHAPGLGSLLPRDSGAVIGLAAGIAVVATWVVPIF